MTGRRYTHAMPSPRLTGGDDRPRPACEKYPEVYDELHESSRTDAFKEATEAAQNLCGTCLLRSPEIAKPCLDGALGRGERWAHVVLGRHLKETDRPTATGPSRNSAWVAEKNASRAADLEALARSGASVAEACKSLGVKRDGLYTWCARHGHLDLWRAISPGTPQAPIKYPRRRKGVAA